MNLKLSEWQDGVPPCDGIWQIYDKPTIYYARFKDGLWAGGWIHLQEVKDVSVFIPYHYNNNPPIKWRGVIEE